MPYQQDAMMEEFLAIEANSIWDLGLLPANATIIGSKWVYSIKVKLDGSLDWYKAGLVVHLLLK